MVKRLKSVYGLKQAGRRWGMRLEDIELLEKQGLGKILQARVPSGWLGMVQ